MPFEQQYNGKVVKDCIQKYEKSKSFRKVAKTCTWNDHGCAHLRCDFTRQEKCWSFQDRLQ